MCGIAGIVRLQTRKLHVLNEKHVLKRAAHPWVPKEIVTRRKQPYRAPDAAAFVGESIPEYAAELLSERAVRESGVYQGGLTL